MQKRKKLITLKSQDIRATERFHVMNFIIYANVEITTN